MRKSAYTHCLLLYVVTRATIGVWPAALAAIDARRFVGQKLEILAFAARPAALLVLKIAMSKNSLLLVAYLPPL